MKSVDYGMKFTLTGPDGTVATFNDSTDANYVGVTDLGVSGIDSADIRESADDLVEGDGGVHGDFFYGRRPVIIAGHISPITSKADRDAKVGKLTRASNAMRRLNPIDTSRGDCTLSWDPLGDTNTVFVRLRRQQPVRITGPWVKQFMLSMVAADPNIYSSVLHSTTTTISAPSNQFVSNPGAEVDTAGWALDGDLASWTGETLTRVTDYFYRGGASFRVYSGSKDATATQRTIGMLQDTTDGVNQVCVAGNSIWVDARVQTVDASVDTTVGYTLKIFWYTNAGATTPAGTPSSTSAITADEARALADGRLSFSAIAPAGAIRWRAGVYVDSKGSGDIVDFRVDNFATGVGARPDHGYDLAFASNDILGNNRGSFVLNNAGDAPAPMLIQLWGPLKNPGIINETTGEALAFNCTLAGTSDYIEIDTQQGTVLLQGTTPRDSYLHEIASRFMKLAPGNNTIRVVADTGTTASSKSVIAWRDTWQ